MSRPQTRRWSDEQWTRRAEPTARAVNFTDRILTFACGAAACAVWLNWDLVLTIATRALAGSL